MTLKDLLEYTPELNESPLKIKVGEYTMHFPGAPSSGPVLALMLNIVDGECVLVMRVPVREINGD